MKVLKIIDGTIVDGLGMRTSVYFAGCPHKCKGCHNPESWNAKNGEDMSMDEIMRRIEQNKFDVTFSGGEPFEYPYCLAELCRRVKMLGMNIWVYTGYKFEHLAMQTRYMRVLQYVDVLVDSPFELNKRDTNLKFRGSSNQRIIDVQKTIENEGEIVLFKV